jgi:hypothetical protein
MRLLERHLNNVAGPSAQVPARKSTTASMQGNPRISGKLVVKVPNSANPGQSGAVRVMLHREHFAWGELQVARHLWGTPHGGGPRQSPA